MDYNVTVELDRELTDDEIDAVLSALVDLRLHPAAHAGEYFGGTALTVTVEGLDVGELDEAVARVVSDLALEVTPRASVRTVVAMSAEDFDALGDAGETDVLSVPQAAALLKVSEQRVRQLLVEEKLSGEKVGRDWVVSARSVQDRLGR